ncbi:12228_t:CDS:1, partial [Acaulospora colombiana]
VRRLRCLVRNQKRHPSEFGGRGGGGPCGRHMSAFSRVTPPTPFMGLYRNRFPSDFVTKSALLPWRMVWPRLTNGSWPSRMASRAVYVGRVDGFGERVRKPVLGFGSNYTFSDELDSHWRSGQDSESLGRRSTRLAVTRAQALHSPTTESS